MAIDRLLAYRLTLFICVCYTIIFIFLYTSDPYILTNVVVPKPRKDYDMYLRLRDVPRPQNAITRMVKIKLEDLMPEDVVDDDDDVDDDESVHGAGNTDEKKEHHLGSTSTSDSEPAWSSPSVNGNTDEKREQRFGSTSKSSRESESNWPLQPPANYKSSSVPSKVTEKQTHINATTTGYNRHSETIELNGLNYSFLKYFQNMDAPESYLESEETEDPGEHDYSFMKALDDIVLPRVTEKQINATTTEYNRHSETIELHGQDYSFLKYFQNMDAPDDSSLQSEQTEDPGEHDYSFMKALEEIDILGNHQHNEQMAIHRHNHQKDCISFAKKLQATLGSPISKDNDVLPKLSANVVNDLFKLVVNQKNNTSRSTEIDTLSRTKRLLVIKHRYQMTNRTDVPEKLYRLAPQVFDHVPSPEHFLKDYKSPCWQSSSYNGVQCLPYFYLPGMPKCGTTDVWAKINSHKGIFPTWKEPHWWARYRLEGNVMAGKGRKSLQWYTNQRSGMINSTLLNAINSKSGSSLSALTNIAGDGSASTLWDNVKWPYFYPEYYAQGPPHIIADIIHAVTPDVKIIVVLRDPVSRLYSDYCFFWPKPTNKKFHHLVLKSVSDLYTCLQDRSVRACTYTVGARCKKDNNIGIGLGFYDVYIRDWLRSFARDQLIVFRLDDWSTDCPSIISRIFKLLDVAPLTTKNTNKLCAMKDARNRGRRNSNIGDILPETKQLLQFIYRPHLENLADELGDRRWLWAENFS